MESQNHYYFSGYKQLLFTLFGNKSIRYEGVSQFTILYIKVNFLICLLSAKFSHPVSKYRERKEAKIGSPVTMRAALNAGILHPPPPPPPPAEKLLPV